MYIHIQSLGGHSFHFFRKMPNGTVVGSDSKLVFHFLRNCKLFYEVTALVTFLSATQEGGLISPHSPTFGRSVFSHIAIQMFVK